MTKKKKKKVKSKIELAAEVQEIREDDLQLVRDVKNLIAGGQIEGSSLVISCNSRLYSQSTLTVEQRRTLNVLLNPGEVVVAKVKKEKEYISYDDYKDTYD